MTKKLLVVEDNPEVRELVVRQLKRRGYDVVEAADGAKAVEVAKADRPDLILMDLNMPVMDGWEAIRLLKAAPATKKTPIVAITAHTTTGDRDAGYEAGADAFVTKPIDFDALAKLVASILAKTGG